MKESLTQFLLLLFSAMSYVKANRHNIYGKGSDRQLMNIKAQLLHIMRLATFGVALCMCQSLQAKTHYIIAYDKFVGNYNKADQSIVHRIDQYLQEKHFSGSEDYISIFEYGLDWITPNMSEFVMPCKDTGNHSIIWRHIPGNTIASIFNAYQDNSWPIRSYHLSSGSMQSIAKQYLVSAAANVKEHDFVDKTYLLMVTDMWFNGNDDYRKEWNSAVEAVPVQFAHGLRNLQSEVFRHLATVNEVLRFIPSQNFVLSNQGKSPYQVVVYEVLANNIPSIQSVTTMPSPLPIKRVRGGFELSLDLSTTNKLYQISDITIKNNKGKTIGRSNNGKVDVKFSSSDVRSGDSLSVQMSLKQLDGIYNGILISPNNPTHRGGMTLNQVVKISDEAKVLGLMPLNDWLWWWYPHDVFTAVMIWDVIIILAFIAVLLYLGYRIFININSYSPSNSNIKIKKL